VHGDDGGRALAGAWPNASGDVRVRFAAQFTDAQSAEILLGEVEALYCAGPAGGAGLRRHLTPRLISASCLVERSFAQPSVSFIEVAT
jgi:hypothetical protein